MMTGVELWVKIYSPNVRGIEVVQRALKRARRARLFYMRFVVCTFSLNFFFNLLPIFLQRSNTGCLCCSSFAAKGKGNADTFGG